MGGTIGFTTITDQGPTFHFDLPHDGRTLQSQQVEVQSDAQRCRALIFGDNSEEPRDGTAMPRILHVKDDENLSHVIAVSLGGNTIVVLACTLAAAEALSRSDPFSLLLFDLATPDGQ
jgi:hypothetical protein